MNADFNLVETTINFESNIFGAELAGYYIDDNIKEEIEA
jgi:hypothetical protein